MNEAESAQVQGSFIHDAPGMANLFQIHGIAAAKFLPPTLRGLNPLPCSLFNEFSLEIRQYPENVTD
jgi:hypothetical protein